LPQGRASHFAIDEQHQPVGFAIDLCENRLIAKRQARRRVGIQHVDASQELPLRQRQFGPFAVVSDDRSLGAETSTHSPADSSAAKETRSRASRTTIRGEAGFIQHEDLLLFGVAIFERVVS
jgi:hypothetical protein